MNDLRTVLLEEFQADEDYAHAYCDEFLNTYIATQLKALREQRDWTQQEVAERAGMKQPRIALMENINYSSWKVRTLRELARAFDLRLKVSFEEFSTIIDDISLFGRRNLERTSRALDLQRRQTIIEGASAITDLAGWMRNQNKAQQFESPIQQRRTGGLLRDAGSQAFDQATGGLSERRA